MEARGYSNSALAEELDFSYEYIYKLATGSQRMSDGFKWRFAQRFGWHEANRLLNAEAQTAEPV
jgi:hypothetical protein